jgi:hypothetical protein
MTRTRGWIAAAALVAAVALPAAASAQVCIGVPIRDGAFGIAGEFQTGEGAKGFGGTLTANLTGPLSVQAGYTLIDIDEVDDNGNTFFGNVAWELPNMSFSVCPVAGVAYSSFTTEVFGFEADASQIAIPIGIGIGKEFAASPTLNMSLFAVPHFVHLRNKFTLSDGTAEESETESENEFGAQLGARIGTGQLWAGAGVSFTTVEDTDPVFSLTLGIALGGR